jgi:hypothetical protein
MNSEEMNENVTVRDKMPQELGTPSAVSLDTLFWKTTIDFRGSLFGLRKAHS